MALSNTQYNTLIRRYEARQLENQHIVMERINSLYPKFPRLAEIDEAISSQAVSWAKKFIEGDESALSRLKQELSALAAEKKEILRSHGYPENYFEPPYQCPDCKDTGYIGRENAIALNRLPLTWFIPSPILGKYWSRKTSRIFLMIIILIP